MNLDSLTDKELGVLVAEEVMGWGLGEPEYLRGELMHGGEWKRLWYGSERDRIVQSEENWNPAAEGNENQAMMVVRKIRERQEFWLAFIDSLVDSSDDDGILDFGEWLLGRTDFGRVVCLAALRAKG